MIEKRFRKGKSILTDFPTGAIIDEKTGERYYDGIKPSYISSKELVKILNELYKENKELKAENERLKSDNFNLNKSVECLDETVKEQCNKIDWADECGVRWEEEYEKWKG